MNNKTGNYAEHASVWDWAGNDRSEEFEFWYRMSLRYGDKVLSAMAALGEAGAYLAERGIEVTALDYTQQMIDEGRCRFGHLANLHFVQGDVRDFALGERFDFAFIGTTDLHHLLTTADVSLALQALGQHLKAGGGLALELWYPAEKSWSTPRRRFASLKSDAALQVWKEGTTQYNSLTKRITISQQVFKQQGGDHIGQFTHEFELQLYSRSEMLRILLANNFELVAEYGDYSFSRWSKGSGKWILEARLRSQV